MDYCSTYGTDVLSTCYLGNWGYIAHALSIALVVGIVVGIVLKLLSLRHVDL